MTNNNENTKIDSKDNKVNKKKKVMYLEYLRVVSIFFVMFHHVACQGFELPGVSDSHWQIYNIWASQRWAIGTFLMISGILFLGRDIDVKTMLQKYVVRLAIVFFVWKFIYALYESWGTWDFLDHFLKMPYHFWYLPMIIGVYLLMPLFRLIAKDDKLTKYYLILAFIFVSVIPEIGDLAADFGRGGIISRLGRQIYNDADGMYMDFLFGFGSLCLLGYYLANHEIKKWQEYLSYFLGILGVVVTVVMRWVTKGQVYSGFFTVNVIFETIAVFILFKQHVTGWEKIDKYVLMLSKWSFGAYIVHVLVMSIECEQFNLFVGRAHPIISVPAITVITFVASTAISALLNSIPFVKKYLV